MRQRLWIALVLVGVALAPHAASALDKVNPYICPTAAKGSGLDCFLEAVPQTYTMCREIKSIEIIEYGMDGAQQGVNGAKTESCIDKHKLSMVLPYQAALREEAHSKEIIESLRRLHDFWLDSLAKLMPAAGEAGESYKLRVNVPYAGFAQQIGAIRSLAAAAPAAKPAAKPVPKHKPASP